jgi:hypothetical protein
MEASEQPHSNAVYLTLTCSLFSTCNSYEPVVCLFRQHYNTEL